MNERTATGGAPVRGIGYWLGAINNQANVIGALLMRELHTRYGRENVGYLWMMLEPMTLATAVALIHAAHPAPITSDIQAVPFSTLGYSVFIMFRSIFSRAESAIESNMPLLYHRMVTVFDILVSRALLDGGGSFVTVIALIFLGVATGFCNVPVRPLDLIIAICYMLWFSFAMSMIACAITHDNRLAARLIHPFTYILMPLSGAFYMVGWLPEPYKSWLLWSPFTHIFELARYGMFRSAPVQYIDLPYLTGCCLVATVVGMLWIRVVRQHVHLR